MRMRVIRSQKMMDYLANNNCFPEYEDEFVGYYKRTPLLSSLLERYTIQYVCIPNRL